MKYSEYFEIDKNYYPEINPDSVKNPGNEWQYTYPHETFVELLSSVELMLSRENTELRKGIWIEGSYGTGKSRVYWNAPKRSFVTTLKKITMNSKKPRT